MNPKKRYIARLDQVTITRKGREAVIAYKDPSVPATQLEFADGLDGVSDEEILEAFNDSLREEQNGVVDYQHVAIETSVGSPKIHYNPKTNRPAIHGDVLRCLLGEDKRGRLVIQVDERKLNLEEFGRLLTSFMGWGVHMEFVQKHAIDRRPEPRVRELGFD